MKKTLKQIVAGALAGIVGFTSVVGGATVPAAAATNTVFPAYENGDSDNWLVVNFLRGTTGTSWEGYDFRTSGLTVPGGGHLRAGNFVKMSLLEKDKDNKYKKTGTHAGDTTTAQIAYCIAPTTGIDESVYLTSPTGYKVR